ncbi:uncharacterized protein BX663DRAFT_503226 [Cokeromyces recurvatus]|uniref:uncharacterized protein n=1 Tax=Cokeromyces recurvatus TaxID=90255 RepID=UPI00221F825A|nr:uncharacterized protein BX663DRAFT_503226 [Cokeromyces recurvatus]KAI7904701.1 hypothetical protein BX663DRAFT_503226 [Cokeromyces recurvatus]
MNIQQIEQREMVRRQGNIAHYYNSNRFRVYCCGCIRSESNFALICFCWAGISFYFSVSSFMQQSPFYSHIKDVPLIIFGAVNLLFGIITLFSFLIFLSRRSRLRMLPGPGFIKILTASKTTVLAITANALGVLAITLINFVYFVTDEVAFNKWCIQESVNHYNTTLPDYQNDTIPSNTSTRNPINSTVDIYNCKRLYQSEIKWSLLAMIIMFIVYIHWILIIAAKQSYNFYRRPPMLNNMNEFGNIAPSAYRKHRLENNNKNPLLAYKKPSKKTNLLRSLLVHKQYDEFQFGNDELMTAIVDDNDILVADNEKRPTTKFIQFTDDKSKDLKPPGKVLIL